MEKHLKKPTAIASYFRIGFAIIWAAAVVFFLLFELKYQDKIYPSVYIDSISFGGNTADTVRQYWLAKNEPFLTKQFELQFENTIATISATELDVGFDATLSARQAYLVGRSGNFASDAISKFSPRIDLTPYFR